MSFHLVEIKRGKQQDLVQDPSVSMQKPAFTQVVRAPVGMGNSVRYSDWRLTLRGQNGSGGVELYNVVKDKAVYYNHANNPVVIRSSR